MNSEGCSTLRHAALQVGLTVLLLIGPQLAAAAPPATVTAWMRSSNVYEGRSLLAAADRFNHMQSRYRVEMLPTELQDPEEYIHTAAATGSLPCLLEIDAPYLASFAWPEYLQSIDRFLTPELRRDLLPSMLANGRYEGRQYALGAFDAGLGLWGNRSHLRAAQVRLPTVQRPWSLAEFEQALARLARVEGVAYPLDMAFFTPSPEFYAFAYLPLLHAFGGDVLAGGRGGAASGVLDGPQSVAAMRRVQLWLRNGWTQPVFDRADDFESRRTALLWSGHWRYRDLRRALGDDLVLLPLPDFGRGIVTGTGSWSWVVSSTCSEPQGAWAFVAFLLSEAEIRRVTDDNGAVPARRSMIEASALYRHGGPLEVFAQQLSAGAGRPRPGTPGYKAITAAFAGAARRIFEGGDAQAELSRAARSIDDASARQAGRRP